MRSAGRKIGCLKSRILHGQTKKRINKESTEDTQSAEKKHESQTLRTAMRKKKELEEAENNFNVDAAIHGFAVGSDGGTHLPVSHGRHGLFFQAESRPLENSRVEHAPVRRDDHVKQHASLVFGLARLV